MEKNKLKKIVIILVLFFCVLSLCLIFSSGNNFKKIRIKNNEFIVETVENPDKRVKGLSGRKNMCESCGMLFIFPKSGKYGFWMKDMKFNLDIIWINNERITNIAKDVPYDFKETITPDISADEVLELNAGVADRFGIEVGDEVSTVE